MKILLFDYKQTHDGKIFDFPFEGEMVFCVPAQIQYLQLERVNYPHYVQVNVYGTDGREAGYRMVGGQL